MSLLDPSEIGEKGTSAKTVTLRDTNEDAASAKSVSWFKKLLTTQVENLNAVSHFIQYKTFSALNYAREIE